MSNYSIEQLNELLLPELKDLAKSKNIAGYRTLAKQELISVILESKESNPEEITEEQVQDESSEKKVRLKKPRKKKEESGQQEFLIIPKPNYDAEQSIDEVVSYENTEEAQQHKAFTENSIKSQQPEEENFSSENEVSESKPIS